MLSELTQAVTDYQKSGKGIDQVVEKIARTVYWYPPMRRKWNEDDCGDFLCYFYKRIPGMIQRYRYKGSPFEAFLKVSLQFQMKSFAREMRKKRINEKVLSNKDFLYCNCGETAGFAAAETPGREAIIPFVFSSPTEPLLFPEDIKTKLGINERGKIGDPILNKRLLFLVLREASRIDQEKLGHCFTLLNYDRRWLIKKIQAVQLLNIHLEERKNKCRARRNQALFNIYSLQEELAESPEPHNRRALLEKITKEKRTQKSAELALARIPKSPTHRQLSDILGVPKGTIDSGLFFLNRLLAGGEAKVPGKKTGDACQA